MLNEFLSIFRLLTQLIPIYARPLCLHLSPRYRTGVYSEPATLVNFLLSAPLNCCIPHNSHIKEVSTTWTSFSTPGPLRIQNNHDNKIFQWHMPLGIPFPLNAFQVWSGVDIASSGSSSETSSTSIKRGPVCALFLVSFLFFPQCKRLIPLATLSSPTSHLIFKKKSCQPW